MSPAERSTLDELRAKYDLEPTLRDVYVEGGLDAAIVEWLFRGSRCGHVSVLEICNVEIPSDLLTQYGLQDGEKRRVIALCRELESQISPGTQVTGIVDRDYDRLLGVAHACPLLLFSDFACMEMYFAETSVLEKYLHFVLRRTDQSARTLLGRMMPILQEIFLIRTANQELGLCLHWLDIKDQCDVTSQGMRFDPHEFIRKYLNKNAKLQESERFDEKTKSYRSRLNSDPRHHANGHDFVQLLSLHVRRVLKNKNVSDIEVVEKHLTTCLDYSLLAQQPMFSTLLHRVRQ